MFKLLFLTFFLPTVLSADEYRCKLTSNKNDKSFKFLPYSETSKLIELGTTKLIMWKTDKSLNIKLTGGSFKEPLSTYYSLEQLELRLKYGNFTELQCIKLLSKKNKETVEISNDELLGDNVKFKILVDLVFPYAQKEAIDTMRVLHFQNKNIFKSSQQLQPKTSWCSLQIQITRDENTTMRKRTELIPVSFDKYSNNSQFNSFSYSFVDFSEGKVKGAKTRFRPFMLTCNLPKGEEFSKKSFYKIVGDFIEILKLK
jgi:hypothetical protein